MATQVKTVDPSSMPFGREVTFDSGSAEFAQDDFLDIHKSLGGPANYVRVDVSGGASCTFRINSMNKRYPPYTHSKTLGIPGPDLQNEEVWTNTSAPTRSLTSGETLEITDMPVSNMQFTALSGTVVVSARN